MKFRFGVVNIGCHCFSGMLLCCWLVFSVPPCQDIPIMGFEFLRYFFCSVWVFCLSAFRYPLCLGNVWSFGR